VWNVCYRFVRNVEDAEDLTQEVFFRAYRSLAQFEGRASLKTWLYRIASNVSQNELRRRSRRPQESETAIEDLSKPIAAVMTPEMHALALVRQEKLGQALDTLKPEAYEALRLKDLEERPYTEIAELLEISQSAAKMRVQRARLALMTAYRQLGD
jgi:RNA polymerase sigma-70 factor (ECF subfamily)